MSAAPAALPRPRARIASLYAANPYDDALAEALGLAGFSLETLSRDRPGVDVGLADLRGERLRIPRAAAMVDVLRETAPDAPFLFIVDPQETTRLAPLKRFGELVPAGEKLDHVAARIRALLRVRNIAEEAGERLKTLTALHRAVDFPVIATDAAPPRVLIVGDPGPTAMETVNALRDATNLCACALTAGQAMRALDHEDFDLVIFMPIKKRSAISALFRTLRRHPKFQKTALLQIEETPDQLARAAIRGGDEFLLASQLTETLPKRAAAITRRARLLHSMREFLRACAGDGVRDTDAGVFTPAFFASHGARLAARADQTGRPLSLIAMRLRTDSRGEPLRRPAHQAARLLGRITRAEDMTARIAPDLFVVLCPATSDADAERIALRIDGVLSNTAFRFDDSDYPRALPIDLGYVERESGEPIAETLARALQRLKDAAAVTA